MDDDEDDIFEAQSFYTFTVNIIRLIDRFYKPERLKVKVAFDVNSPDVDEDQLNDYLYKIQAFVEQVVENSIIMSNKNDWAIANLATDNMPVNNKILSPLDIDDVSILTLLMVKFEAISENTLSFYGGETSANKRGLSYFVGSSNGVLPDAAAWFAGEKNYFDEPWWNRCDSTTMDVKVPEGHDPSELPNWAKGASLRTDEKEKSVPSAPTSFKPVLIVGGKEEKTDDN